MIDRFISDAANAMTIIFIMFMIDWSQVHNVPVAPTAARFLTTAVGPLISVYLI